MEQHPVGLEPTSSMTSSAAPVEWSASAEPIDYAAAVEAMEARAAAIAAGQAPELVWLLEHPPVYTAGTSARTADLLQPDRFPVLRTGRGGQFTYHGPGQRVIYVMLEVKRRARDVRAFVAELETWMIDVLAELGVAGETRPDRVGIWVTRSDGSGEDKIAALGLRLRKWISLHGVSLNVRPDLSHYDGIVPCGIKGHGVTSLAALGIYAPIEFVDNALRTHFERRFGATRSVAPVPVPESTPA